MNKGTTFAVWWQHAGGSILETLDDCSFPRTIVSYDKRERGKELDGFAMLVAKRPDPQNLEFVNLRHFSTTDRQAATGRSVTEAVEIDGTLPHLQTDLFSANESAFA